MARPRLRTKIFSETGVEGVVLQIQEPVQITVDSFIAAPGCHHQQVPRLPLVHNMVQTRSSARQASEGSPLPQQGPGAKTGVSAAGDSDAAAHGLQPSTSGRSTGEEKDQVFHKGVAISMWQNSGDDDSNWTNFIKSNFPFAALPFGFNRFSGKHSVLQTSPDTWNR